MSSSMVSERTFVTSTSSSTIEQSNWEYIRPKLRPDDTLNLAGSLARSTLSTTATALTNDLDDLNQTLRADKLEPIVTDHPEDMDAEILPDDIVEAFAKESIKAELTSIDDEVPEPTFQPLRESLCAGCNKVISGRCVTAMFRKFHPEHFVCSFCLKQLNKGTFKVNDDKPYCHECYDRLFR